MAVCNHQQVTFLFFFLLSAAVLANGRVYCDDFPHRFPQQYWLKNHWLKAFPCFHAHWPHSNLAILYASLLSAWYTCIQLKKTVSQMKLQFFSDWFKTGSWDFKVVKKWWAGALLTVKCCCFVRKPRESHTILNYPIWRRRRWRKKQKHFGCLPTFWFSTFASLFCLTTHVVGHENTWTGMVCCHTGLQVYHFWDFFCIITIILYVCEISTHSLPNRWYHRQWKTLKHQPRKLESAKVSSLCCYMQTSSCVGSMSQC